MRTFQASNLSNFFGHIGDFWIFCGIHQIRQELKNAHSKIANFFLSSQFSWKNNRGSSLILKKIHKRISEYFESFSVKMQNETIWGWEFSDVIYYQQGFDNIEKERVAKDRVGHVIDFREIFIIFLTTGK